MKNQTETKSNDSVQLTPLTKHGISIRNKKTNELVDFIDCTTGNTALRVLRGISINLNHKKYKASEEFLNEDAINDAKQALQQAGAE